MPADAEAGEWEVGVDPTPTPTPTPTPNHTPTPTTATATPTPPPPPPPTPDPNPNQAFRRGLGAQFGRGYSLEVLLGRRVCWARVRTLARSLLRTLQEPCGAH